MAKLSGKWLKVQQEIYAVLKNNGMEGCGFRVTVGVDESRIAMDVREANADPFAGAKRDYERYAATYGFQPEWLGKTFNYGGQVYKLEGFDLAKPKNCMVLSRNGKTFVAPREPVLRALKVA